MENSMLSADVTVADEEIGPIQIDYICSNDSGIKIECQETIVIIEVVFGIVNQVKKTVKINIISNEIISATCKSSRIIGVICTDPNRTT